VYRRLFLAQVVALAGTGLATVALGLVAYDLAGERAGAVLATVFVLKMIAYVAVAPVAAAAVAALPPRTVLVAADVVRLAIAVCLPFVTDAWQIYLLVLALQAASATFTPTFQAVIPRVLPDEDDYTAALSLSRLAYDLEAVLAPVLAALALLLVTASTLFLGTAVGFAGSALLVASVALPHRTPPTPDAPSSGFVHRARAGTALLLRTPALRPVLALNLAVAAGGAFVLVQSVVIVRSTFAMPEGAVALVLAASGLGSMLAALSLPRLLRLAPERVVMLGGAALVTVAVAVVPWTFRAEQPLQGVAGVMGLWLLIGIGWSCAETPVGRILRRHTPAEGLPAAFAAQFSLSHACWLLTYPLAGWLALAVGLSTTALVLAGIAGVGTLVAAALWPPAVRTHPVANPDPHRRVSA
jgi:hypothetical protein